MYALMYALMYATMYATMYVLLRCTLFKMYITKKS